MAQEGDINYVSLLKVIYNEMEINLLQNNGNINDLK